MSGTTPPRPSNRMPAGLLGMLLLVTAVELILGGRRLDFTTVWADDWRRTAEVASTGLRDRDVLLFGDSMIKIGVFPKVIEARTGLRSYNLALNAGTMPTAYFLLRRALDSGAKPKAIVADLYPLMWQEIIHDRIGAYSDLATVRDCLDLGRSARDSDLTARALVGKVLVSYRHRFDIRSSILAAFQGRRASPWPAEAWVWEAWKAQDGAQPLSFQPEGFAYDPKLLRLLMLERWSCDAFHEAYVEKFLALAASKGIPVFWLIPPMSPRVYAQRRPLGTDAAYDRFIGSFLGRYPNVVVLDARDSGYDDSVHVDLLHLERRGAKVLSADLASLLADRLGRRGAVTADRWVALPAIAGRSGDEPSRSLARSGDSTVR